MLDRQVLESESLAARQTIETAGKRSPLLQVSFPFPEVFEQARTELLRYFSSWGFIHVILCKAIRALLRLRGTNVPLCNRLESCQSCGYAKVSEWHFIIIMELVGASQWKWQLGSYFTALHIKINTPLALGASCRNVIRDLSHTRRRWCIHSTPSLITKLFIPLKNVSDRNDYFDLTNITNIVPALQDT